MAKETPDTIFLEEATKEVEVAITRVALLHLAFSKTLVQEMGEDRGKSLIVKAIMEYGDLIAKFISRGGKDLPSFGMSKDVSTNDDGHLTVKGCTINNVFKQFDEMDLGRLYCLVDAAKTMATDLSRKIIHSTCEACGDANCTFDNLSTTEEERNDFLNRHDNWKKVDPRLTRE
ncbi:MAG: hypothetical protein ACFFD4_05705 [Candidatus Odinarchaeota archaeon]